MFDLKGNAGRAQRSRLVLGALLGDRGLRVCRDGRIEGRVELEPEMKLPAPRRAQAPAAAVVAGD